MDKKILDKIKKCLRLAKSSNPNEAATAFRQAQALMEKHGITKDDVGISDVEMKSTKSGAGNKPPSHIIMLGAMVCGAFGADMVLSSEIQNYKIVNTIEFIGIGSVAEIASYAYEVLLRQLTKDRKNFLSILNKRLKTATKTRRADIYCQGWIIAVREKITLQTLNEKDQQLIASFKQQHYGNALEKTSGKNRAEEAKKNDRGAFGKGIKDGEKVKFHQGVTGSKSKAISHGQ